MTGGNTWNMDQALGIFFQESREMLEEMEAALLDLEKEPKNSDVIDSIFRAAHTIKGSAGMFNIEEVETFTHVAENVLEEVRRGHIPVDRDLIVLLLECHDYIMYLLSSFEKDRDFVVDSDTLDDKQRLLDRLNVYLREPATPEQAATQQPHSKEESPEKQKELIDIERVSTQRENGKFWHISLRFKETVFEHGLDPASFINYLNDFGKIEAIKTVYDALPPKEEMLITKCFLGFEIEFDAVATKEKIEDVFDFIKDDCNIRILPPESKVEDFNHLIKELPEEEMNIGKILIAVGALTERELEQALNLQQAQKIVTGGEGYQPLGEIVVESGMSVEPVVQAALNKQKTSRTSELKKEKTIRIESSKIDTLINLVGELVISGANVKQKSDRLDDSDLQESVSIMARLVDEIRDSTMSVRMVPVGETFRRFERIVHDLSRESGKDIQLEITGGDTELDKTLIDKITDPLCI